MARISKIEQRLKSIENLLRIEALERNRPQSNSSALIGGMFYSFMSLIMVMLLLGIFVKLWDIDPVTYFKLGLTLTKVMGLTFKIIIAIAVISLIVYLARISKWIKKYNPYMEETWQD